MKKLITLEKLDYNEVIMKVNVVKSIQLSIYGEYDADAFLETL